MAGQVPSGGRATGLRTFIPSASAPSYLKDAIRDIGIVEYVDDNGERVSNPIVQRFVAKALAKSEWTGDTITTPWCAFYANAKLEYAGIVGTRQGMARSFLRWGDEVEDDDFKQGDIVVLMRGSVDDHVLGHVGFLLKWDDNTITMLGGNQNDMVCIEVFDRHRILGVRRPRSIFASKTVQKSAGSAAAELSSTAVDKLVPDTWETHVDRAADLAENVRSPLELMAQYKPWIAGVLTGIAILLAVWAAYHRISDHNSGKNS